MTLPGYLFPKTCRVRRYSDERTEDGDLIPGQTESIACRQEAHVELVQLADGTERRSRFLLATPVLIGLHDAVALDGADENDPSAFMQPLRRREADSFDQRLNFFETLF